MYNVLFPMKILGWAWFLKLQQEVLLMANSDEFREDATGWSLAVQVFSN